VLGCAKHFPNHGAVQEDSHELLPRSTLTSAEIEPYLIPYRRLMRAGISMIMPAHIDWTRIDGRHLAGTFSEQIIHDLLRRELGYDGVVISDAMEMKAATDVIPVGEAAVWFLRAGGDMILSEQGEAHMPEIVAAIKTAVRDGQLSEKRINESVRRICAAKTGLWRGLRYNAAAYYDVDWADHQKLAADMSQKSIRRYGSWGNVPIINKETKILVVSSSPGWKEIVGVLFTRGTFCKISYRPKEYKTVENSLAYLFAKNNFDAVVLVSENKDQSRCYRYLWETCIDRSIPVIIFSEDLSPLQEPAYAQLPLVMLWGPSEYSRRAAMRSVMCE
jgi:beta-glucosidase-like glycosyl hydrolase